MKTNTNERRRETLSTIGFFALAALILIISIAAIITVTKIHATNSMREDGRLVTITSFVEHTAPHRETIAIWDYNNDTTNEHYTNIEYYEYSGTYVVEVSNYDGKHIGRFEVKPEYNGEDEIILGAEIEMHKLQNIKKDIEKVTKETVSTKELLQSIKPVVKQERTQKLIVK